MKKQTVYKNLKDLIKNYDYPTCKSTKNLNNQISC
jgi:hypothetical protein